MSDLSLVQALVLLVALVEWLNNLAVGFGLVHLLLLLLSVFSPGFKKLFVKLFDDVQILVSDNGVVVLDVVVLLVVLVGQLQDGLVLLVLDLLDLVLSLFLHLGSQVHHLVFEFLVDFVGDTLELLAKLCLLLVFLFRQSVKVLLVTDFLLLFGNFEGSQILLELTLVDAVLIFNIFQGDLSFFLKLSELIEVLKDKMLTSLLVNFNFDLMLFLKILQFSFLVSKFSLLVFEFLLADEPEVINTETFVHKKTSEFLFCFDHGIQLSKLDSHSLLVFRVIDIVNRSGGG